MERKISDNAGTCGFAGSREVVLAIVRAKNSPIGPGEAWVGGHYATGLLEYSDDPTCLDTGGWWAAILTFEGQMHFWRFAQVSTAESFGAAWQQRVNNESWALTPQAGGPDPGQRSNDLLAWQGPAPDTWSTSLSENDYCSAVEVIRSRIAEGEVYQVNLCRVMTASMQSPVHLWGLTQLLSDGNPAPFLGLIDIPGGTTAGRRMPGARIVSASPELFLRREGPQLTTSPIKGTAPTADELLPKDTDENIMITDLMRNDLQQVSDPGTVEVASLLEIQHHPGLVHLVSTVTSQLNGDTSWSDIFSATMPPGSVSGAPKSSALRAIRDLEPVSRGPYCGAIGWIDADAKRAELAVGIRTFWLSSTDSTPDGPSELIQEAATDPPLQTSAASGTVFLNFGTGAGITWGSDAAGEWAETELKANRLIGLASTRTN